MLNLPNGDREDIYGMYIIITTEWEVPTIPIIVIFGCVSEVVLPSHIVSIIYILWKPGSFPLLLWRPVMSANNQAHYEL